MNWHERYKEMKTALGYTNADIARITGNTPDSIKSSTQPNNEIPRWLKLAIVVYETSFNKGYSVEALMQQQKGEVEAFIRNRLAFDKKLVSQLKYTNKDELFKEHRRFEMSGYESRTGECTLHNLSIVNEFADLGIYDYTDYLFLDFHKGSGKLYLQYFQSNEREEINVSGEGTVDIIYKIFEKTIFSNYPNRRRI
jgi:hypothetical protein